VERSNVPNVLLRKRMLFKKTYKKSSGDEIANVNFFYDDTLQSYTHFKIVSE